MVETRRTNPDGGAPPPPDPTPAQLLALIMEERQNAREERQAHLAALQQIAAAHNNNNNGNGNGEGNHRSTLSDFQKTNPPTYSKGLHPLEADDWLRTIANNLEVAAVREAEKVLYATHYLAGPARAWWEATKALQQAGYVINWAEFQEKFRKKHIPDGLIERKKDEFRRLRQGSKDVVGYLDEFTDLSRYAPEDTDTEKRKMERFLNGLHDELQCALIIHDFFDLETLVNKAIQLETKRKSMFEGRKRRMNFSEGSDNQKPRIFQQAPKPVYRPPQAPRPNFPSRPNNFNRPNDNTRPGGNYNNANRNANVVCFECGAKGHYSRECPNPKRNVQRPNAPAPNNGQGHNGNGKNAAPRGNAAVVKGRLHHINAEEAEDAPDVVLGTFLVNSVPATVLFDSGATHSFVTKGFVSKGGLAEGFLVKPMSIQIPGSTIETKKFCPNTSIEIGGEIFAADLIILGTQGIDVILGMNWLAKFHGRIDCARRAVSLTSDKGVEVEYVSETSHSYPGCHESIAR
jgi:hypothetical protein